MKAAWIKLTASAVTALALALPTAASAQGVIAPGELKTGTIAPIGHSDSWTFAAKIGEAIVVRVGEASTLSGNFYPRIRLLNPSAVQLATSNSPSAAEVAVTAAANGTYTIIVDDLAGTSATGTYRLTLAKTGSDIKVSPGDEGGELTNGALHTGNLSVGDLDVWTVWANIGEAIVVRMGEGSPGISLYPYLRIYSPEGSLLDTGNSPTAAEVTTIAGSTGSYMVVAGDVNTYLGGSGDYRLTLAKTGSPVVVSAADEGGELTNGALNTGNIGVGDLDLWTISANVGEAIIVRMGEGTPGISLYPYLRIYSPEGKSLGTSNSPTAAEVSTVATTTGTYLVVVGDVNTYLGGSGEYRLTMAKTGSPVVVSPADEGGPMTNGALHTGTIDVGDLDVWTVSANAGEAIVVRMGEGTPGISLYPYLRIYGPAGTLLDTGNSPTAAEVTATATTTGTYLVVVGDVNTYLGGSGDYRLTLAKTGSAVVVSPADQGGPMTNGALHTGTIDVGDLDVWTVSANVGEAIVVRMGEGTPGINLYPYLRIYGPDGTLLDTGSSPTAAEVTASAVVAGTYLVVVGDVNTYLGGSGSYRLTLAKTNSAGVVSPADEGGPIASNVPRTGIVSVGDLDLWTIAANVTDSIKVTLEKVTAGSNLYPFLRIYGPKGALLASKSSSGTVQLSLVAPAYGTYLIVVGDLNTYLGGTGDYKLTVNRVGGAIVGTDSPPLPHNLQFAAPWPNPARQAVNFEFQLPARAPVRAVVMDVAGRQVISLADGSMDAGTHRLRWDGRDAAGSRVASGVYLVRVSAGTETVTRRVVRIN